MKCSVCLNDYTEPMREIVSGPVCDSCWGESDEKRIMDERMEQFQFIQSCLKKKTDVQKIDISEVKHLLPTEDKLMDEAWLYKPTDLHPYYFVRVWRDWGTRNCFQDLSFSRPDVAEVMKGYIKEE